MKIKEYILEGNREVVNDVDEFNSHIHRDCKYYLSLIRGMPTLYRGMQSLSTKLGKASVRTDRISHGMSKNIANNLNTWLEKHNAIRRDKALFSTPSVVHASMFGSVYKIFPIGKFNYTWVASRDINYPLESDQWKLEYLNIFSDINNDFDKFKDFFTFNKDFKYAYNHGYEIWMDCKEYYYADNTEYNWNIQKQIIEG